MGRQATTNIDLRRVSSQHGTGSFYHTPSSKSTFTDLLTGQTSPITSNHQHRHRALTGMMLAWLIFLCSFLVIPTVAKAQSAQPATNASAASEITKPFANTASEITEPLQIHKAVDVSHASVGQTVTYSITLENSGSTLDGLHMEDSIPAGMVYVAGSAEASAGDVSFNPDLNQVDWYGTLATATSVRIVFQATIAREDQHHSCGREFLNKAILIVDNVREIFSEPVTTKLVCPDLGDAPDSTNHSNSPMLAYPAATIGAHFPTVFDPSTGTPAGPIHRFPEADAWLGMQVSGEHDADLLPDVDGVTNIKPHDNSADYDHEDDGVVSKPALVHCERTELQVLINVVGPERDRFVNVWFDWNRDGDWNDSFDCPGTSTSEWAVQNAATKLGPGQHVITLPAFLPHNPEPNRPLWARVTLAEMRAPFVSNEVQEADGRGPAAGYQYGETEDYYIRPDITDPNDLVIKKRADVTTTTPGGLIEYTVTIQNSSNVTASNVTMIDPIPAGTTYISGSTQASLPTGDFDTSNMQVKWQGDLPPNGTVDVTFKAKVNETVECAKAISNRAALLDVAGSPVKAAEVDVRVNCPGETQVDLSKRTNVTTTIAGGTVEYTLQLHNSGSVVADNVTMIDPLPAGTKYLSGTLSASSGTVAYEVANNKIKWTGDLGVGESATVTFKVKVLENALCEKPINNRAAVLLASGGEGRVAEASIRVQCKTASELRFKKEVEPSTVVPGGVASYKLIVENTGATAASNVNIVDPLPAGTTLVAGSLTATTPTANYDATNNKIVWNGTVPATGSVTIKFQVTVSERAECNSIIPNRAVLFVPNTEIEMVAEAGLKVHCDEPSTGMDFGDAPDSLSNHHTEENTAYPSVLGRFPTVWGDTPSGEASGPAHASIAHVRLGKEASAEKDADLLPDGDGVTNILASGSADVADQDKGDDGWLNRNVPIENCRETMFHVRVSRSNLPLDAERLYLNVWFDGNRDGDWADVGECDSSDNLNRSRSHEWIVQNYKIDATALPAGGYLDYRVPTVLVSNLKPEMEAWLRFSLSEDPATRPTTATGTNSSLPDGRGPAFPTTFRLGETEDYLRPGVDITGKPGKIEIEKIVDLDRTSVTVGDLMSYAIYLTHSGGTAPATAVMTDVLPAAVELAGRIEVFEENPSATPLLASFNPGMGPSGTVSWRGQLSPNAKIKLVFPVRVKACPRHDENSTPAIRNVAEALQVDGTIERAVSEVPVTCEPTQVPEFKLTKRIVIPRETDDTVGDRTVVEEETEGGFLSGEKPLYLLRLESSDNLTHEVTISDTVPTGLVVTGVKSNFGQARVTADGSTIVWKGVIGPNNQPAEIKLEVRPTTRIVCGERMVNVAHWWTNEHRGESNPVTIFLVCRDLGDAPDSTNHAGVAMEAYSGVKANFPTVFKVAAPERGPMHRYAHPFHLGEGVTSEFEADSSFDSDGVHNIEPTLDRPNLDRRDDGLRLDSVNLRHCEFNTMKVAVSIDSTALSLLAANDGMGYLNIWVDSNRDGDWADNFACPGTGTADNDKVALEHIVIDLPINAAILGAGMHELLVDTTVPVAFPNEGDVAGMPAWLRVTLSEKPSNKTLSAGDRKYGDGRGYEEPFRLGETEDYLLRTPGQTGEADLTIKKRGHLQPEFDPTTQTRFWQVNWVVNYANIGGSAATNVQLNDTLGSGQTLQGIRSIPSISPTVSGGNVNVNLGTVAGGSGGTLILKSVVPYNTAPGTVIRNEASIAADNDSATINNTTVATVTVPLLPPLITSPVPGTTCTGTLEVTGHAQASVEVDIYVNGSLATTATADGNGDWSTSLTLPDGTHDLYAIARQATLTSEPTPVVTVIVDSSLFWNPMSLRFTDENGRVIRPSGRLDESGWSVFLRAEHTYTISLQICCEDPNVQVELELNGDVIPLSDENNDGLYTATFTSSGRVVGNIRICVVCELIKRCSDGELTIDPEGTVFNLLTGQPIEAATVACFQATLGAANTEQSFALWPAADYGQINPQAVGTDGYFSFFTPPGTYQLDINRTGYQPYRSWNLVVVDAPVHFDVPLTPLITQAADHSINVTDDGFEPAVITVEPGAVIEWTNVGDGLHTSTSVTPTVSYGDSQAAGASDTGAWDSGLLTPGSSYMRQLTQAGTYTYRDNENPAFTATIIVAEAAVVEQPASRIFLPLVTR